MPARAKIAASDAAERAVALVKKERDLLDRADLHGWMSLFCEDGVYWMPSHIGQTDPHAEISLFFEDRSLMEIRAENFGHRLSPSMAHPVRSCRLMEIASVEPCSEPGIDWKLSARFHAAVYYRGRQSFFAGWYEYLIRFVGSELLIKRKRVDIINVDAPLESIVIYL